MKGRSADLPFFVILCLGSGHVNKPIAAGAAGRLRLPNGFGNGKIDREWWVARQGGAVVLLPRAPDLRKLYVEPTTDCGLNCVTCVRRVWPDPVRRMEMSLFRRLVLQCQDLPDIKSLLFGGIGEPTQHPNIMEMVGLAKERALTVTMSSNGVLLDRERATELVRLGLDRLVVSIDGVDPATYREVRGVDMSRVLSGIQEINAAKKREGSLLPRLEIEFVVMRKNVADLSRLSELAGALNANRVLVSHLLPHTEEMRGEVLYGREPTAPLTASPWAVDADAWVLWGAMDLPRMHWGAERRCPFVRDKAAVVGWDGAVMPCYALCHNYEYFAVDGRSKKVGRYQFGNIGEQSLRDIWSSEDYCRFRHDVGVFHFPSCPDCDLRDSCDLREANEGCWGWSPSCADCLYAQDIVRCPGGGR
jgi:tungsten cofactor oxidoreducase radical SAM maturase